MKHLANILPPFPRTPHLPHKPNLEQNDLVASEIHLDGLLSIEEKVDGASVGITIDDEGNPVIRNREHILKKGYTKKETTAKLQFRPLWNYFYANKKAFLKILEEAPLAIYGEWMWAQHGIHYTRLPDWFIPYDIYNYELGVFLSPVIARAILRDAGFHCPTLIFEGEQELSYDDLEIWANSPASWADGKVEGIYLKVHDGETVIHRYKMVREDYRRGTLWDNYDLKKNDISAKSSKG